MANQYCISGIDIGNSHIKVVTAKINRETLRPEILGVGTAPSHGLRRGMVVDMEETVENIRAAVQQVEAMAGIPVRRAYLSVSGLHINTQSSRGVIAVSRADGEISQNDIDRVIQAASVVSLPANREIIHVIPKNFIVDGTEYVKNPLGMKGVRLEAEVFLIDGLSTHIRNVAKCVNENNIEVAGLVFAPLAASLAALDKNQREYGVVNIDFGGGTSHVAVYQEADLVHTAILPVGSRHITNDLAIALRTSIDVAERIKLEYGTTSQGHDMRRKDKIDISELLNEENFLYPRAQLVRVVDARAREVVDLVDQELQRLPRTVILPAGVVLSGGGANLPGFASLVKEVLRLPVRVARPLRVDGILDTVSDPSFTVAIGLVLWGLDQEGGSALKRQASFMPQGSKLKKAIDWLKNFLP